MEEHKTATVGPVDDPQALLLGEPRTYLDHLASDRLIAAVPRQVEAKTGK